MAIRELENSFVPKLLNCKTGAGLKKIHAQMVKLSLSQSNFLVTKMVDVCDYSGNVDYASLLFKQVVEPNVFLFNAMIRAYTHNHIYGLAITLYKQMLGHPESGNPIFPDKFTFPFVIKCCAGLYCEDLGRQVHGQVCKIGPESHLLIENALVDFYTKCDHLRDAHKVFEEMTERDVITWNSLLTGYVRLGQMRKARAVFEEIPDKTIVSWTAMVSGYTRIGCYGDALDIFRRMQMLGIEPDEISVVAVLPACSQLGALEVGKWIHRYSDKKRLLQSVSVCNALIEMYVKCGCIDQAWQLFDQMLERDVISWSTMIAGLANNGKAREAVELFQEMQRAKIEPNGITFLGLLSACSHAGLWKEGLEYFDSMRYEYKIEPGIEHYGCLVDLLGRAGHLDQALDKIKQMPMKPDSKIWGSLLSSCRTYCNLEIALDAMEQLQELEPDDAGNYVLLSNIYADLGRWEDVSRMRKLIRSKSMKKTPGCSLIEVNNAVLEFVSGDDTKPFAKDIFSMLELLVSHQSIPDDNIEAVSEDCC
ncbi:pentatricopeptide repeat-containing protein At2g20540 [Rosa rugosa]|uniref:pentatricopeptide repeat-containing protein At2g20540 n=1 Tax=Rosa rugosa TaxID=74645 RepID=UPI002B41152F|nr:pentatricopeptide repeat-containing protein At2g20540 [Rosa rugosa]